MATVYLANDVKHEREVAVKVLLPELSATVGSERFEREIRVAARLHHPHILGLYDSGTADGQLYYVMPFVKGESLRDRLDREGQLPIEDALQIILEVNDALGHAHAQGIVHRDIKPENILLSGGHAVVADFGIARAVAQGTGAKLTQTGMSLGTPHYMSPEQFTGEEVGPPSDLYALGCVLYETLAGEPPFAAANQMVLMAKHAMEQVPSVRIARSTVPEDVENAIYIAMNKAPADRPQSAEQFAQLLGFGTGTTASMRVFANTMTRRAPTQAHAVLAAMRPPWWKRPTVLGTAGMAVVAVAGVLAWNAVASKPSAVITGPEGRRLAVLYFSDLSRDGSLRPVTDGMTEGLIRSFSNAASFDVVSATGAARYRDANVAVDSIARALRVGYLVRGEAEREGTNVRVSVRLDDAMGVNLGRTSLVVPEVNILAARDTITTVVGDLVRRELGRHIEVMQQGASTSNADSWLLTQRGDAARRAMDASVGDTAAIAMHFGTADSLFTAAARADSRWADPVARRALLGYRRSRLTRDPAAIRQWVAAGLVHADAALAIDPDHADALEVRGNLLYWGFLNNFEEDATRKAALIDGAKAALERAVARNPRQAGAYATLSHLYLNHPDGSNTDAVIAAQRAYEADEFLAEAELVLSRLVVASYDLGQFDKANQWCRTARARFPASWRSARCQLLMMTTPVVPPDIPGAWRLADTVSALAPNPQYYRLNSDMLVGAVIARASRNNPSLADSARRVIRRSEADASIDPTRDLGLYGAIGYTMLGDHAEAIRLLKSYLAVNPQKAASFRDDPGWQYRPLANEPAYRRMVGGR